MSARLRRRGGFLVTLGAVAALLGAGAGSEGPVEPAPAAEVATLTGSGGADTLRRLGCVGCIATIYMAGGGSPLGIITLGVFRPDAIVACATLCYMAVT